MHPDPERMAFLVTDETLSRALRTAWLRSEVSRSDACVTWSVLEADRPCNDVHQGSLGPAFAVALEELERRRRRFRPQLRRLDPNCAVTGTLEADGRIAGVDGYEPKLRAARTAKPRLRVVLPQEERQRVEPLARGLDLQTDWAATIADAIRLTRNRWNRTLIGSMVAILVAVLVGTAVAYQGGASTRAERDAAKRGQVAADLAAQATTLKQTDPRLAALLALSAYRIAPSTTPRAVDAMRDVLADNQDVARSWKASPAVVDALEVDGPRARAYTAGDDPWVKAWDLRTGRQVGKVRGAASRLALNKHTSVLAVYDGHAIKLLDTHPDNPAPLGSLRAPACGGRDNSLVGLDFTTLGVGLVGVWADGTVAMYDVVTRTPTGCWRLGDLAFAEHLDAVGAGRVLLSAGIALAEPAAPGQRQEDEVLALDDENRVLSMGLRSRKVRVELSESEIPGEASIVRGSADILTVATAGGVLVWDRAAKRPIAYPAGGLSAPPTALELENDQVIIASAAGTASVSAGTGFVGASTPSSSFGLEHPHGGAATVAAASTEDTIMAGGPDGRVAVIKAAAQEFAPPPAANSTAVSFAANGTLLLADVSLDRAYSLYTIHLHDRPNKTYANGAEYKHVREYHAGSSFYANAVASSPEFVAAAGQTGDGGAILVWDAAGKKLRQLVLPPPDDATRKPEERLIIDLAFIPQAHLLVGRHVSGQVGVWSTVTWQLQGTLDLPTGSTAMTVYGTRGVFTEGGGKSEHLVLVDLPTRKVLRRVAAPEVYRLASSADGSRLVTLSWGNKLQLRDAQLEPSGDPWQLPPGDIGMDLAITRDARRVAVTQDARVLVYDAATATQAMPPLQEASGHDVIGLAWSPDGSTLAATTLPPTRGRKEPGVVNLWAVGDADWTTQICRWTGGGLSRTEWDRYVGAAMSFIDLCRGVRP